MVDDNSCGCCKGPELPSKHYNRPGMPSISYRLGTHSTFLHRMLQRLHSLQIPDGDFEGTNPLSALTTRDLDDLSIALLDSWATIADVITFYQERIASEGYLRTATERRSVLELAREIGYELRPGVASSTYLAFTAEGPRTPSGLATGAPDVISVPKGLKVQSLPAQGKLPQTFETADDLFARAEWNILNPLVLEHQVVNGKTKALYLKGTATRLQEGDPLLIVNGDDELKWSFQFVKKVAPCQEKGYTLVTLENAVASGLDVENPISHPRVFALRQRASLFGYNAPDWRSMSGEIKGSYYPPYNQDPNNDPRDWPNFEIGRTNSICLSAIYPSILPNSWAVLEAPKYITEENAFSFEKWGYHSVLKTASGDFFAAYSGKDVPTNPETNRPYLFDNSTDKELIKSRKVSAILLNDNSKSPALDDNTLLDLSEGYQLKITYSAVTRVHIELIKNGTVAHRADIHPTKEGANMADKTYFYKKDVGPFKGLVIIAAHFGEALVANPSEITPKVRIDGIWQISENLMPLLPETNITQLCKILNASTDSCTNFTLTSKVSRLKLDLVLNDSIIENIEPFGRRETSVYAQSEELKLADRPFITPVFGKEIILEKSISIPEKGRKLIFSGDTVNKIVIQEDIEGEDIRFTSENGGDFNSLETGEILTLLSLEISDIGLNWKVEEALVRVKGTIPTKYDTLRIAPYKTFGGTAAIEVGIVEEVSNDGTKITLKEPLKNIYDRSGLKIYGNVASATHGETVHEVLGSGNGSMPNQSFFLKKPPLTYVPASTASGALSALSVTVNDVPWVEVPSLYGLDERCQCYTVRIDDDDKTRIIFGDGYSGARLPTGSENVRSIYRSGLGPDGEVDAGKIILIQAKPLGIREVTNPLPAIGSAPPEKIEDAKRNAPRTVLTLDRVVSLQDYEDFARGFAGIGKVRADEIHMGENIIIHLTIGSAMGGPVGKDGIDNLLKALDFARDISMPVIISNYTLRTFSLKARVLVDPYNIKSEVMALVKQTLIDSFSFNNRSFSQPVTAAEMITIIQSVKGVVAVDLESLKKDKLPMILVPERPSPATPASARPDATSYHAPYPVEVNSKGLHGAIPRNKRGIPKPPTYPWPLPPQILPIPPIGVGQLMYVIPADAAALKKGMINPAELLLINLQGIDLEAIS